MKIEGNHTLVTDLYELTMAAAYFENDINRQTTFELYVRSLPVNRGYLLLAGMDTALEYIENLHFEPREIDFLRSHPVFSTVSDEFFDYLRDMKPECDVWAMPEGTLFFPNEPVLRVTGPAAQAQMLETYILSAINFESMVATKASRVVHAARGRGVADFGSRRAHGPEASVRAARACYIGGCGSTSNVYAGLELGIPITGTAAHSWTMVHDSELDAFRNYFRVFPENTVLLIDTYDVIRGAERAVKTSPKIRGVRIDSGDLTSLAEQVRRILDDAGMADVKIVGSGDLDEYKIEKLLDAGAPYDLFGVGTKMVTSEDAPNLGGIYKLVSVTVDGKTKLKAKFSDEKVTYPGSKQVWRKTGDDGMFAGDVISLDDELLDAGAPLIDKVFDKGRLLKPKPGIEEIRERAREQLEKLPERYRRIEGPDEYPVEVTRRILDELEDIRDRRDA